MIPLIFFILLFITFMEIIKYTMQSRPSALIIIFLSIVYLEGSIAQTIEKSPFDYVNPFIGTGGDGHTYPGATVPFGMVQVSPDTEIKYFKQSFPWCAGYQYGDSTIVGFSHTHFSGTGHSDMGDVLLMPLSGELQMDPATSSNAEAGYRSRFSHEQEEAEPGYYAVSLLDEDIDVELTATSRVGFHKYTYNQKDTARIILDLTSSIYNYDDKVTWSHLQIINDTLALGMRQTRGWAPNRTVFFAIVFSNPITSYGILREETSEYRGFWKPGNQFKDFPEIGGKKLKAWFNFEVNAGESLLVKVGISAVDASGALNNLVTEIPHWNFEQTRKQARSLWEKELNKIIIKAPEKEKEIFYTSLYHAFLSPVEYFDIDLRYRGLDLSIQEAYDFDNYTIYSLWDTYRALHPLFTIVQPQRTNDMISSMLAHYRQNSFHMLPVWSFHGNETWCMIGYHAVSVIADAWLKGIRGFDENLALEAMLATSTYGPYDGLEHYIKYGYVPIDLECEGASKTLEYAYDDFTIAMMAKGMGKEDLYAEYYERAANYQNIYDFETGFMRATKADGSFREPFDPFYAQYGGDYTEGNAWQYSWYVPHDVKGLINLMGGEERFVKKLDSLFILETSGEKYKHVEDIAGLIGQYAHGNEPSQHIAYLYNYAGMPWKTQEKIHQVMNHLFDNTPYGICGNEDCGQMSAWYIFSSMGFYPVCPGTGEYVIGTPALEEAILNLDNGKSFKINVEGLSEKNYYIKEVSLNGNPLENSYINHADIVNGGEMTFVMGSKPNKKWATKPGQAPFSMSK